MNTTSSVAPTLISSIVRPNPPTSNINLTNNCSASTDPQSESPQDNLQSFVLQSSSTITACINKSTSATTRTSSIINTLSAASTPNFPQTILLSSSSSSISIPSTNQSADRANLYSSNLQASPVIQSDSSPATSNNFMSRCIY